MPGRSEPRGRRRHTALQTYPAVERLVAAKNGSKADAFKAVAKRTGRAPASISTSYYRIARLQHGGARGNRRGGKVVDAVMDRAAAVLNDLRQVVRRQQREIAKLRAQGAWAERVRKMLRGR
jgi:hypothetical protein